MNETKFKHIPVMLKEVMEYLDPKPGNIYVDGTVGLAGHARAIAERLGSNGRLVLIDKDNKALGLAQQYLSKIETPCDFIHGDIRDMDQALKLIHISKIDGVLFDLGISSFQLDDPERGFSLRLNGPLDMRMNQESHVTAYDLINSLPEKKISSILKEFGEERWHNRIARYLVQERKKKSIETTDELVQIVLRAMPYRYGKEKIHPATRTFQAFRIAVNKELESLSIALDKSIDHLKIGGRIGVISFHSLEDRIVKKKFRDCAQQKILKLLTRKPLRPSLEEEKVNPRARSARFRVAERIK